MVVDPVGWDDRIESRPSPPLLDAVQSALIEGVQLELVSVARDRATTSRVIHPLGLAAKGAPGER